MPFRSRISLASAISTSDDHNKHGDENGEAADGAVTPVPDVDMDGLPPPVLADRQPEGRRGTKQKKTRISLGMHVRWDRFLRKLGSGTAPSTSSAIDESIGESSGYSRRGVRPGGEDVDALVDEVVVDREWSVEIKSSIHSGEHGTPDKSGGSGGAYGGYGGTNTDRDSVALHVEGFWASWTPLVYIRYRMWPVVYGFFATHFVDDKSEAHYRKENWFLRKVSALLLTVIRVLLSLVSVSRYLVCSVLGRQLDPCGVLYSTSCRSFRQDILLWRTFLLFVAHNGGN